LGVSHTAMHGVYHITDGATIVGPNQKTTLDGDLFIITNGRVEIRRDFDTVSKGTYRLVIVSTSTSMSPAAILWSNNITMPPNVQTLLFTYGLAEFTQLKTFSGIVYAGRVDTDNNFSITYEPSLKTTVPGFDWDLSSARAYEIRPLAWTECRSPTQC
ncbi:MAG: hypothetical protein ACRDJM_10715, partial [Actinomycetota bacterium]